MTLPPKPRSIFISYAHADNSSSDPKERWLDRLLEFLKPLDRQGELTRCSDEDIRPGENWHEHIQAHLCGAKAAVLLVSPAFLASDYIADSEMPVLLKHASQQGVKILSIVISPCLFAETKFRYPDPKTGPDSFSLASLQSANPPSKTLDEMTRAEQNRVLLGVAQELQRIVNENPR